jgi:hypothetical protein
VKTFIHLIFVRINNNAQQENDMKALADKIAAKKAREEAIARGEIIPEPKKGSGGGAKKKDGTKK